MGVGKKVLPKAAQKQKTAGGAVPDAVRYRQVTVEISFTDGERGLETFHNIAGVLGYIENAVSGRYADSVRIELF
jgi:hypothetical protein